MANAVHLSIIISSEPYLDVASSTCTSTTIVHISDAPAFQANGTYRWSNCQEFIDQGMGPDHTYRDSIIASILNFYRGIKHWSTFTKLDLLQDTCQLSDP